jgi:hypothetical protein
MKLKLHPNNMNKYIYYGFFLNRSRKPVHTQKGRKKKFLPSDTPLLRPSREEKGLFHHFPFSGALRRAFYSHSEVQMPLI